MASTTPSVKRHGSHSSAGASSTAPHSPSQHLPEAKMEGESPNSATPAREPPRMGQESFWSPRIREQRMAYIKAYGSASLLVCIVIWAVMSIYWGSVWKPIDLSPNLNAWIINRDTGIVGSTVQDALLNVTKFGPKPHSTWTVMDPALFPTQDDIDYHVSTKLSTWIVATIAQDATAKLEQARANGDSSWDPRSLITLTYATACNFQVVPSYVLNPAVTALNPVLAKLSSQLAAEYLSQIAGNQTAIANLARAPQTIASPIIINTRDTRIYDTPVAIAVLVVGLIYVCILAFIMTMTNFAVRQPLQPFLSFRSLVAMRILAPVTCYLLISLMISLLNIPFKLPFDRTFSYGGGFMVWWCTTFVGMTVLGLVTECAISLVGPRFIGFVLVFWIIINVSVANLPIELSPSFYKYGYSVPFYSIRQIYIKVIFDVGERIEILKWFGILWAWLAVVLLTFPIWIWRERRSAEKARQAAQGATAKPADSH